MALNYRAASGSDRIQPLNEPYHLSYESVESRDPLAPAPGSLNWVAFEESNEPSNLFTAS